MVKIKSTLPPQDREFMTYVCRDLIPDMRVCGQNSCADDMQRLVDIVRKLDDTVEGLVPASRISKMEVQLTT